jgi:uncharacterized membrane protein YccC
VGQQAGISFVVAYTALSPNADFYTPLWRVWGIFLGFVIVMLVFLFVAPEYAGMALAPRAARILRGALELIRPAPGLTEQRVQEVEMEATLQLTELLRIAEEARVEGQRSGVNPDAIVEAAGTLRRIVHRLSGIASARLGAPQLPLPTELQAVRDAGETALRHHLQSWLAVVEQEPAPDRRRIMEVAERFTPDDLAVPLEQLNEHLSKSGLRELASWPATAQSALLSEIESYRRLVVLMTELDFSASERFNAELVHETRRHPIPEHDLHVRQVSADIQGIVTVRDIVAISGIGGAGFRAVVRLIADRYFELAAPDIRIDYDARIRRR